jgi:hypothetical protein
MGSVPIYLENVMAKGQQRSNREKKKPKQPKKAPAVPLSPWKK